MKFNINSEKTGPLAKGVSSTTAQKILADKGFSNNKGRKEIIRKAIKLTIPAKAVSSSDTYYVHVVREKSDKKKPKSKK